MLIINQWYGQNGNNILQIIRCIHYAKLNNHNKIIFPYHFLLKSQEIIINDLENNNIIQDTFFSLKKYNIKDPSPKEMKDIFQMYIKNIFNINFGNIQDDKLYIHFRGGDIFGQNPHKAYVQPPLKYYKDIIKNYDDIILVCQDKKNPCINELLKESNIKYESNELIKDLEILSNIKNLIIGFGTFGFLLYLMNINLKNLYIPKYFVDELPEGEWGDINIHIIDIPNYIKVGEWNNTIEQREIMLKY